MNAPQRLSRLQDMVDNSNEHAEKELVAALSGDGNDVVRHEAAFLLGSLERQRKIQAQDVAFKCLCDAAAKDTSILVRHEVAMALAQFRCEQSIDVLIQLRADTSGEVVRSANYALAEMLAGGVP